MGMPKNNETKKKSNIKKDNVKKMRVNKNKISKTSKKKNKKSDSKLNFSVMDFLIVAVIISLISCIGTGLILNYQYKKNVMYNSSLISDDSLNDFIRTYLEIVDNYYEEVDRKEIIAAATSSMVSYLKDNYSIYLDEDAANALNDSLDSSYEGMGIVVAGNYIYYVYPDSPASSAGLKEGDVITSVNGTEINEENVNELTSYVVSGEVNHIVVLREKETLEFDVETNKVYIPTVSTKIIQEDDKKIGYLILSSFSTRSYDEFKDSLEELEDESIESLIIDLRGNSGGYLDVAKDICSLFLNKGKIIYSTENKNDKITYYDETSESRDYNIVVLVNTSTASAAEVLTAALKDSYGATVVGQKTFGKGKVQTVMKRSDYTVKYTSSKWLRPNGECVDGEGITPDYVVDNVVKNKVTYDQQLDKAIELLSE